MGNPAKKDKCDHFWELDYPVKNWHRPRWKCMNCGKKKYEPIPLLDLPELEEQHGSSKTAGRS